jgi:ribosomal protein L37E
MIFRNPAGAPELACDACGCRWFDRMHDTCYECGAPVAVEEAQRFAAALQDWMQRPSEPRD